MKMFSCMPNDDMIDFWIKNNLNVLFYGKHGVGKTSMILDGFKRNNIKFLQFSAATMDPWVDFVGVPKEIIDEKGSYLELIRPKAFRDDEVEALFFDELNRSHKKVRNAVMELIQFKSINGKKFPHLKMIWGAVNPEEDESDLKYDVEKLDPAQADRFHVHLEIPYKPYMPYFREKYGREIAQAAIDWWNELPANIKQEVSPRRLEYAINMFKMNGNLVHILPPMSNVDKLTHSLRNGSPIRYFKEIIAEGNNEKIKNWLGDENNYSAVKSEILKSPESCLKFLPEEKVCSLASINDKVADHVFSNHKEFQKTIEELAANSQNKKLQTKAKACIAGLNVLSKTSNGIVKGNIPSTVINLAARVSYYKWNPNLRLNFGKFNRRYFGLSQTLSQVAGEVANASNQTPERIRICNSVIKLVENNGFAISLQEAKDSLNIIDWVASKTQTTSIHGKTENIVVAVNKCVSIIKHHTPGYAVKDFVKEYPSIAGKLIAKATGNQFQEWCIIP